MSQSHGYELEAHLVAQNQWLAAQRQAILFKVPDNAKIVAGSKGSKHVKAVRQARAWVDFAGMICGSGQAVALEAKATSAARWSASSVATEHQLEILATVARHGGFAALYVRRLSPAGTVEADYLLPYSRGGVAMFPLACAWQDSAGLELESWRVKSGESWLMTAQRLAMGLNGIKLDL